MGDDVVVVVVVGQRRDGEAGAALRDRGLGVEADPLAARLAAELDAQLRVDEQPLAGARLPHLSAATMLAMGSPQTLSEGDRRIVAAWAADCAERALCLFEAEAPEDRRPRQAIARTRAFARGDLDVAEAIRRRFAGGSAARDLRAPAAAAAARAAGQAAAVAHMGAHALGAAAYAAKAVGLAAPDQPVAVAHELRWQLSHMSAPVKAALRLLPPLGEDSTGPLGPGLLASGLQGTIIRDLQAGLANPNVSSRPAAGADV